MVLYSSIVDFLNRNNRRVNAVVDLTLSSALRGQSSFDSDIPLRDYVDRYLLLLKLENSTTIPMIASVVAEEQELPQERPPVPLSAESMSNLKIGRQIIWTARYYELLERINNMGLDANIRNALEESLIGTPAFLVPGVVALTRLLMIQILTTATARYRDPWTDEIVRLDYPGTFADLLPAALTGAANWNAPTTANALADLRTHALNYYAHFESYPDALYLHRKNVLEIGNQASFRRQLAYDRTGSPPDPAADLTGLLIDETRDVIPMISSAIGGGRVEIFDAKYKTRLADGTPRELMYLADDVYFFWSSALGAERAMVPTVEKKFAAGLYQASRELSDAPRRERTAIVGNYIPYIQDARYIAARKVNS